MFNTIFEAIDDFKQGKILIVVDDQRQSSDGAFIIPAQFAEPDIVNFMAIHGGGLICCPITIEQAEKLNLELMIEEKEEGFKAAITTSIDAIAEFGVTSGNSINDRSITIKRLASSDSIAADFTSPGHIFPLLTKNDGVMQRRGHSEAVIDLAKLAGLNPAGLLCEILNMDGSSASISDLIHLSKETGIKIITIEDIVSFRKHISCFGNKDHYEQFTTWY